MTMKKKLLSIMTVAISVFMLMFVLLVTVFADVSSDETRTVTIKIPIWHDKATCIGEEKVITVTGDEFTLPSPQQLSEWGFAPNLDDPEDYKFENFSYEPFSDDITTSTITLTESNTDIYIHFGWVEYEINDSKDMTDVDLTNYSWVTVNAGGEITGGTFNCDVYNKGTISGGTYNSAVWNYADGIITGGKFTGLESPLWAGAGNGVTNKGIINGGTFVGMVYLTEAGEIKEGVFSHKVSTSGKDTKISGGIFDCSSVNINGGDVSGGTFSNGTKVYLTYDNSSISNPEELPGIISGGYFDGLVELLGKSKVTGGTFNNITIDSNSEGMKGSAEGVLTINGYIKNDKTIKQPCTFGEYAEVDSLSTGTIEVLAYIDDDVKATICQYGSKILDALAEGNYEKSLHGTNNYTDVTELDSFGLHPLDIRTYTGTVERIMPTVETSPTAEATYGDVLSSTVLIGGKVCDGANEIEGTWNWQEPGNTIVSIERRPESKKHIAVFTPNEIEKYKSVTVYVDIVVKPKKIEKPTLSKTEFVYDNGNAIDIESYINNFPTAASTGLDEELFSTDIEIVYPSGNTEIGDYFYTFTLKNCIDCIWSDETNNSVKLKYKIIDPTTRPSGGSSSGGSSSGRSSSAGSSSSSSSTEKAENIDNVKIPEGITSFIDVDDDAWYASSVKEIASKGIMKGVSDKEFAPNEKITRAMFVTILHRIEDEPEITKKATHEDIETGSFYEKAAHWSNEKEIVTGYNEKEFAPNDIITREQIVTILYRYAKYKNVDVSVGEDTNILSYEDAFDIGEFAIPAMQWACGAGVISGKDGRYLDPKGYTTRAESAKMIIKMLELIK